MKTPNKIYMPNELLSEGWQRHIEGEDTCYISKDALLDIIKEQKKIAMGFSFEHLKMLEEKVNLL